MYSKLDVSPETGPVIVRGEGLDLHSSKLLFATPEKVFEWKDVEGMSERERGLLLKRAFVRRAAVRSGLAEKMFDSEEAARYIFPRLEMILEDYYYYKKGDPERVRRSVEAMKVDDESLSQALKDDPSLAKAGVTEDQLRRKRDRILERMFELRMMQAKQKSMEELLRQYHPEVL